MTSKPQLSHATTPTDKAKLISGRVPYTRPQKDELTLVLEMARAKIAKPERWLQGTYARMANGLETPPTSVYASCWCAEAAILWALSTYERDEPNGHGHGLSDLEQRFLRTDAYAAFCRGAFEAGVPRAVLARAAGAPEPDVAEINDAPDTTHAHVLAAFTEAIRELGD